MGRIKVYTCIKMHGETRKSPKVDWRGVVCFVSYGDVAVHRKIIEDSFQYHLGLDLDYMKQNHPDHFWAPHNVSRAILLYHYFRDRHYFFKDGHWDYVGCKDLPDLEPNSQGKDFKLWVMEDPFSQESQESWTSILID